MGNQTWIQTGILLVLFGGFALIAPHSTLGDLGFFFMLAGLCIGLIGAMPVES